MSDNKNNTFSDQTNNKPKPSRSGGGFFAGFLALLALIISATGLGLGFYAWQEFSKKLDQASVDRQSIQHEVSTIDENIKLQNFKKEILDSTEENKKSLEKLSEIVSQQAETQNQINESVQDALNHVNRSQIGWGLREIEHILRMASHRLALQGDIGGAITALKAADDRLKELDDDRLLDVRESIAKNIGELKNFPYPDWVGISLQIDNLLSGIKRNLIRDASKQKKDLAGTDDPQNNDEEKNGLGGIIDNIKNSINKSVKVTHEEQKLKLFINQQEKQRAYEFLQLKLIGAKYAVASRDDEAYHRELNAALEWLKETKSLRNKSELISDIEELNEINLEPKLPEISDSTSTLIETIEKIENS